MYMDPTVNDNFAIKRACYKGHVDAVRWLLEDGRADPSDNENLAVVIACYYGHSEVAQLLLQDEKVDPSASNVGLLL